MMKMQKEDTLEVRAAKALIAKGYTISTAESCTGGLISHRLTNIPGSSGYFERGTVVYSNESKIEMLGVPKEVLIESGAVSEQTAKEMAEGVRKLAKTDFGLAVTGIAGPDGGTNEKPVGLVYIALASSNPTIVKKFNFRGDRMEVKEKTSDAALKMLLSALES
jgi:PncC family amidohydrolase